VERDVLPDDWVKHQKKRKVKPVREIAGVGYRRMRIAVVRHLNDINESTIHFT
jgi:hypothetical protein